MRIDYKKLAESAVVLLLITGFVTACATGNAAPRTAGFTESEVRAFADPAVDSLLQAMNTGDYAGYTANFDEQLKKNVTPKLFDLLNPKKIEVVGNYVSREFAKMVPKDGSFTLTYKAKFTKEPADVTITVIIKDEGGKLYVGGLNFDSPLMRQGNCC